MTQTETRHEKLDLRLTPSANRVLRSAAIAVRRSVSEFVLESALALFRTSKPAVRKPMPLSPVRKSPATTRSSWARWSTALPLKG